MRSPLLDLIRSHSAGLDAATLCFALALLGLFGLTARAIVDPASFLRHAQRQEPVWLWAATQPLPMMYTGEHDYRAVPSFVVTEHEACATTEESLQHVPITRLTGSGWRGWNQACGQPIDFEIHSAMWGHEVSTRWRVHDEQGVTIVEQSP